MYYAVLHGTIRGRFRTQVEAEDCLVNYGAAYWFVR